MPLPHAPVCLICATEGHKKKDCPEAVCGSCHSKGHTILTCPVVQCNYCKGFGHIKAKCPKIPPCGYCNEKGRHATQDCPEKPKGTAQSRSRNHSLQPASAFASTRIRVKCTVRDAGIPPSVRGAAVPLAQSGSGNENVEEEAGMGGESTTPWAAPTIVFPNICTILTCLMERLKTGKSNEIVPMEYDRIIEQNGGAKEVIQEVLSCIEPALFALEGNPVSPSVLFELQMAQINQGNLWERNLGYLDFVTDIRDASYLRNYVGQTASPQIRIRYHIQSILQSRDDTLHYYIVKSGRGNRSANFLRLWTIEEKSGLDENARDERLTLLQNVLELLMCRAFQSLPGKVLKDYFGEAADLQEYTNVGLNVISPLSQGLPLNSLQRHSSLVLLSESPDPEIRAWPAYRKRQKQNQKAHTDKGPFSAWKAEDYRHALEVALMSAGHCLGEGGMSALREPVSQKDSSSIRDIFSRCLVQTGSPSSGAEAVVYPVGSANAKVGIVLDYGAFHDVPDGHGEQMNLVLPWGITETGFNEHNSLIWTFNHCQYGLVESSVCNTAADPESQIWASRISQALVQCSAARVILMCGPNSENSLVQGGNLQGPYSLNLGLYTYRMYTESDLGLITRIYIRSPGPLSFLGSDKWKRALQIREIIKFVAIVTHTDKLRPSLYQSGIAYVRIIRQAVLERDGYPKMTLSNIDFSLRDWMREKGFESDESVLQLENTAGSLTTGLLMLLRLLPKQPDRFKSEFHFQKVGSSAKRKRGHFDRSKFEAVKELYTDIKSKREERFGAPKVHQNLEIEHPGTTGDALEVTPAPDLIDEISEASLTLLTRLMDEQPPEANSDLAVAKNGDLYYTPPVSSIHARRKVDFQIVRNQDLRSALFRGDARFLGMKESKTRGSKRITIHGVAVNLTKSFEGYVHVRALLSESGTSHPKKFAQQAVSPEDAAARLAFEVTGQDAEGNALIEYPKKRGSAAVANVNNMVEWLLIENGDKDRSAVSQSIAY